MGKIARLEVLGHKRNVCMYEKKSVENVCGGDAREPL